MSEKRDVGVYRCQSNEMDPFEQTLMTSRSSFYLVISVAHFLPPNGVSLLNKLWSTNSLQTLERSYLLKINGKVAERPQHMLMRVSVGIHKEDIDAAIETYNLMSERWFTHASPTLFNSGTPRPQLSSCFLLAMKSDSIEGIFDTVKNCATISKWAGGIGLHVHCIRAFGSYISGVSAFVFMISR